MMNNNIKEKKHTEHVTKREAREKVKKGIKTVCTAIRSTIGPCGRNAFIDSELQPVVTNDGVSIARAFMFEDPFMQMGAWLVNNTCDKTFDDVGDSTTTTASLLDAITDEGMARPENPIKIRKELKAYGKKIEKMIIESAKPITTDKQIKGVATISAESEEVGELISNVIKKVGKNRPIRVEDNMFPEVDQDVVEGLETKVGYASPLFITKDTEGTAELEDVYVFASDRQINAIPDIKDLLGLMDKEKITSIVFLVANMDKSVKGTFAVNKIQGRLSSLVIEVRGTELEDMAAVSGATLISDSTGIKLSEVKLEHLGHVKKITSTEKKTLILGEGSVKTKQAVERLRKQAKLTKNIYEAQYLNKRADDLEGGIAIIKVGAPTDTERSDLKLKIINAVNATKSALEEGIVEGGGMCLYRISERIKGNTVAEKILRVALKNPLKDIIENAGEDYPSVVRRLIRGKGYDAYNNKTVDMFKEGIVDSAKSARCSFVNALSSAGEFLTVDTTITTVTND